MFSFIKVLDICEDNISFTFHGNFYKNEDIRKFLQQKFFGRVTFVYNDLEDNNFIIICKNKTCSNKLKKIEDIKDYLNKNLIN